MISKNSINNIIHKLHLDGFINSQKELLKDNRGGFLIPVSVKVTDVEYGRYRHLPINWSIPPITKEDLPDEFSKKAVRTVDMFRRKTFDLDCECLIFFDINTGNIVSCNFADEGEWNKVTGEIYPNSLKGMNIASLHNHPKQFCSPPSGKNFEMLGLEFEEYELILSKNELWILESKGIIFDDEIKEIREDAEAYLDSVFEEANLEFDEGYLVLDNVNQIYGDLLLINLNNKLNNIKLTRRFLNE